MAKTDAVQGDCFICGKTAAKTAMKNHVLKEHNSGDELCRLIKAEGAYDKNYWLLFTAPLDASLSAVDTFLRKIWCECCGHLSAFSIGGAAYGKTRKISSLAAGDKLLYEYDFGSTTEILLTVVEDIARQKQRDKICLLARNEPIAAVCEKCGAPAAVVNVWDEWELLCDNCAKNVDDDAALLPVVNSPRCGVCGYEGALDLWTFDPGRPLPQIPRANSRRGVWVREAEE